MSEFVRPLPMLSEGSRRRSNAPLSYGRMLRPRVEQDVSCRSVATYLARISHQVEWPAVLMPGWHRCEARERLAHSYASTFLAAIEKQGKNQRWGRFSPRFARGFSAETPRELRWPSPASVQQRLGTHVGRMASKFWYTCRNTPS